jgi:hypothetical protein
MRRRPRTDANSMEIVKALRQLGCSVRITSALGQGFPDLACGRAGVNLFLEVKDGTRIPSQRKLKPDEQRFKDTWAGQYYVVESVEEAVDYVLGQTER